MESPLFLTGETPTVIGKYYAIYPNEEWYNMNRYGAGKNTVYRDLPCSPEYTDILTHSAVCFETRNNAGNPGYMVMRNTSAHRRLWRILDCAVYCRAIKDGYAARVAKRREIRKALILVLLRKNMDMYSAIMISREYLVLV